jgi:hypothetical protein
MLDTAALSENQSAATGGGGRASSGGAPGKAGSAGFSASQGGESGEAGATARGGSEGTAGAGNGGQSASGSGGFAGAIGGASNVGGSSGAGGSAGSNVAGAAGSAGQSGGPCDRTLTFDAVSLDHDTGRLDEDGWGAFPAQHNEGLLGYLVVSDVSSCKITLKFHTLVSSGAALETEVVGVGFFDLTDSQWLEWRTFRGKDIPAVGSVVPLSLGPFSIPLAKRAHDFDFDMYWFDAVHVKLTKVEIVLTP